MLGTVTEDYPEDQLEFDEWFATDAACREYLERLQWPEGFVCPRCQEGKAWRDGRGRQMCARCLYPVSATAGTISWTIAAIEISRAGMACRSRYACTPGARAASQMAKMACMIWSTPCTFNTDLN